MNPLRKVLSPADTAHGTAAAWAWREEEGPLSGADRAELQQWLDADPDHHAAWEDVRLAFATIGNNAADDELMAMRSAALSIRPDRRWGFGHMAAVIGAFIVLGSGSWIATRHANLLPPVGGAVTQTAQVDPNRALHRTAVGERSTITLPDGSVAMLDTDSVLRVAYSDGERGIRLMRGQALFDVAKHELLPFQVYAGDRRITAMGTKFNVRLDGFGSQPNVSVALLEGVVKVAAVAARSAAPDLPAVTVTMAAGEMLVARPAAPVRVVAGDTERAASWQIGVLTFQDAPLDQAVEEVNRYSLHRIVLADPRLARLRVSGVFKTGDTEHFANLVAQALPVSVGHLADGSPALRPRN